MAQGFSQATENYSTPISRAESSATVERGFVEPSAATDNCNCECHRTVDEVDKFLAAFGDVTNPQFRAWYCKAIYTLGCQSFLDLADTARKGKQPAKLFSRLLKSRLGGGLHG